MTIAAFLYSSPSRRHTAHRHLRKLLGEDIDADGFVTAKPVPVTLWPPEERINRSLGKGEGLKGVIRMRWAKSDDVKKKGAKRESQFYKKYGPTAGKDGDSPRKKRREEVEVEVDELKLDADLDEYLGKERRSSYSPPPSQLRSDDGRGTLVERTSRDIELKDRVSSTRRRRREGSLASRLSSKWSHVEEGEQPRGRGRMDNRPLKTRQDLDDELDAFLNERD